MTMSQLLKVMPVLKEGGFYYHILDEHPPVKWKWIWHTDFFNKYDCKKLQVIRIEQHFYYSYEQDVDYDLTLKLLRRE